MFRSVCKVGTGFTDKSLEDFYSNLEKQIIKINIQGLIQEWRWMCGLSQK
ncbi:MAG TPA: hypothetical protein VK553_05275 [Candidatus Nitrosopolaris rasttigaisensis]|nr:hypothetical protein [Candidatus Nitrosopolaris rasttigaisensis]